ncbi:MAG: RNA polymerase sigma factor [Deltaproteobacteria bacterium]|nr:RNA polymerase sigma factor [Deltaproteobacteria bacterium]
MVDAARGGDPKAFGELVRRYRPRIYALALHMTGSTSDADDIAQDAFLRAFNKLPEFEGRSEFFTWVYRIALHRALNAKRDKKRRPTVDMEDPRVSKAVTADAWGDPRRASELRETYSRLLTAFDLLSPLLRTTVVLVVLQGLSHAEAAVVLGTNEGTIAWRVHEARSQLKRHLDHDPALARDPSGAHPVREPSRTVRQQHRIQSGPHPALAAPFSLERALALLIA